MTTKVQSALTLAGIKAFEEFLADDYDYATDDASAAVVAASAWSSANQRPVWFTRRYRISNPAVVTADDAAFVFAGSTFDMADTGSTTTTVTGAVGKVGLHFKQAHRLSLIGSATFNGLGTAGATSLMGVLFDHCDDVSSPAFMRFKTFAIGRGFWGCQRGAFGDVHGNVLNGLQTFEAPPTNNAGTLELFVGSVGLTVGDMDAVDVEKPARYFSVDGTTGNNKRIHVGATAVTSVSGSDTSQAMTIRCLVDGSLGPVVVDGVAVGVLIQQQATDAAYDVDRVHIASVSGTAASTAASVDALVSQETSLTSKPIGTVTIGSVNGVCNGTYGIACTSGRLLIGPADLSGDAARQVAVFATTGVALLRIEHLTVHDNNLTVTTGPVSIGNSGAFECSTIDFTTGPEAAAAAGVRYESGLGTGSFIAPKIGLVRYRQNGSTSDYSTVIRDTTHGFSSWDIRHIDGAGSGGQATFGAGAFAIRNGRVESTGSPSPGGSVSYTQGDVLWKSNAAAGGSPGWYATTGGTSFVFTAMASLAP